MMAKSWHLTLAEFGAERDLAGWRINFCQYAKHVFQGMVKVVIILAIMTVVILWPLGDFLGWAAAWIVSGMMPPIVMRNPSGNEFVLPWVLFGSIYGTLIIIGTIIGSAAWVNNWRNRRRLSRPVLLSKEPGFASMLFRRIRDKVCFDITIPSNKDDDPIG